MATIHMRGSKQRVSRSMRLAQNRAGHPMLGELKAAEPQYFDAQHMKILSLSRTPVAGVAVLLPQYFNRYTEHKAKSLVGGRGYLDGRRWAKPDGILGDMRAVRELISWADCLIVHNGLIPVKANLGGKRVIVYYHSEPRNVRRNFEKRGVRPYVIAQGHALMYRGVSVLPNIIDIESPLMQPIDPEDRARLGDRVIVGYAPSNRHGISYMKTNKYSAKGYPETMPVLQKLEAEGLIKIKLFEGIPFEECMNERKQCDIFIDEVITGSYHRSTLEACCQGQVVINAMSQKVAPILAQVAGTDRIPWVRVPEQDFEAFEETLRELVKDKEKREQIGKDAHAWMHEFWHPKRLLEDYYVPALKNAKVL